MDEQQEQAFEQVQEQIREQLAADQGSFAAKDEMQHLALMKVKLERDLAEITQLIQQENGTVAVTESARQQQAPVEVPPEEKPGLFKRVTVFFKNLFKKEQKPYPWYTKRQQKAFLKRERVREEKYALARQRSMKELQEFAEQNPTEDLSEPQKMIEENYQQYYDLYTQNGWRQKNSKYDETEDPAGKLSIQKMELQAFFRELGNANCFRHVEENGGKFPMNVGIFSKEDIIFILNHPNEEGIRRALKEFFEMDFKKMEKEYPMHTITTVSKRGEMYRKWYAQYHRMLAVIQWVEKFGEDKMSPEYAKEYAERVAIFNLYTAYMSSAVTPGGVPLEVFESLKEGTSTARERASHQKETAALREKINRQAAAGMDFGDRQPAELYRELEEARFVTEDGRMRMSGLESYDLLRKYAEEDINYYTHLEQIAVWLLKHRQSELEGISQEEYRKLADYKRKANALSSAILIGISDGLNYPARQHLREEFNGIENYWETLFSHMDEYEQKKKAEKKAKK